MNRTIAWLAVGLAAVIGLAVALIAPLRSSDGPAFADRTGPAKVISAAPDPIAGPPPTDSERRMYLNATEAETGAGVGLIPANTRSVLRIDHQLDHGEWVWDDNGVTQGPVTIQVDLRRQMVSAYRGGHEIGTSVILYGGEGKDTPLGQFPIKAKSERHFSRTYYNAPMPFSLWLTDDGVALHGSDVRWGAATHGCVGLPVAFARRLFEAAERGDMVQIVNSDADAIARSGITT